MRCMSWQKSPLTSRTKRRRPLLPVPGPPAEQLGGEGVHAGRSFTGPDGPEDGDSGIESPLGDDEPFGVHRLPGLDRMMGLADHEGRGIAGIGHRPRREQAGRRSPGGARFDPDAPHPQGQHAADQDRDAGRGDIPCVDGRKEAGRSHSDQDQDRDGGGVGKRPDDGPPNRHREPEKDQDHMPPLHIRRVLRTGSVPSLPAGINETGATSLFFARLARPSV